MQWERTANWWCWKCWQLPGSFRPLCCWNFIETECYAGERMSCLRGSVLAAQSQLAPWDILSWLEGSSLLRRVIDRIFWVCWQMSIMFAGARSSGRCQASPKLMESAGWRSNSDAAGRGDGKSWTWSLGTGGKDANNSCCQQSCWCPGDLLPWLPRLASLEGSHRHQRAFMNLISTWPCLARVSTGKTLVPYTYLLVWGSWSLVKCLPDFSGNFPFAQSNLNLERGHRKYCQRAVTPWQVTLWREPWNPSPEPLL